RPGLRTAHKTLDNPIDGRRTGWWGLYKNRRTFDEGRHQRLDAEYPHTLELDAAGKTGGLAQTLPGEPSLGQVGVEIPEAHCVYGEADIGRVGGRESHPGQHSGL